MQTAPMILVADDDPLLAELVGSRLRGVGLRVTVVPDGVAALEMIPFLKPAVVVLEAMMPRMDGYEVLRRISRDPATTTRVIMLSARGTDR